jgi:hypothetical protein
MKMRCGEIYRRWRQKALVYLTPEMGSMNYIDIKCSGTCATGGAKIVVCFQLLPPLQHNHCEEGQWQECFHDTE